MSKFENDPNNLEFNDLLCRLAKLGQTQAEIATVLEVSAGQVSRVKKGERRASKRNLQKLRKQVRALTDARNQEPAIPAKPLSDSPFGMNHATLRALSSTAAVEAFRELLWARAASRGIPTTCISISSDVNVADGGVDAMILSDDKQPIEDDELLTSGTRFQIKTGDFAPWQKAKVHKELFGSNKKKREFENLGSEIQIALVEQKRIVLVCFGNDPVGRDVNKSIKFFKDAFRECGYPDVEVDVWFQNQLIGLFQKYPSLCLRLRGHNYQGFRSHESRYGDHDMLPSAHYSCADQELIKEMRTELITGKTNHFRIIGEPGVGKTRLSLEVTSTIELSPVTLFVTDGKSLLQSSFINELIQSDDKRFILFVIDECSPRDLADIWRKLRPRSDRIKAITIDHGPDSSNDDLTRVITVTPSDDEQIQAILLDHGVSKNDADRWANYCEGSPRVAHVIGENLHLDSQGCGNSILASPTASNVWLRFVEGRDAPGSLTVKQRHAVLHYISLFERFGYSDPVKGESEFIQSLVSEHDPTITPARFQEIVGELRERKVVQGGTTLYITPKLFQIHLFQEFWRLYGRDFDIAVRLKTMPSQMWHWFVQMLPYGHDCVHVENAIERLLCANTVFESGKFPDTLHDGQLLSALSETSPKQVLSCLKRTIGKMDNEELKKLSESRQHLVWALEKISVWENDFRSAANLLLLLAETENSNNSSNATETFCGLFSLIPGWGPTQACPEVRLPVLSSALDSDSPARRTIALKACVEALRRGHTFRTVGPEYQGVRPTIEFWIPETYGELWNAYEDVWNLMLAKLATWTGSDREQLISSLIESSWSLIHVERLAESVVETLEDLAKDSETHIAKLVGFAKRQIRHQKSELSDEVRSRLVAICENVNGTDFLSRLRRFTKYVSTDDYYDEEMKQTRFVEDNLNELAIEICKSPKLLDSELPWLLKLDSSTTHWLGYRISHHDPDLNILPTVTTHYENLPDGSTTFLAGYLAGIFRRSEVDWEQTIFKLSENASLASEFSDLVVNSGMNNSVAKKTLQHCRDGKQGLERLESWWFRSQLQVLDPNVVHDLVRLQFERGAGHWGNAVKMFHTYYFDREAEKRELPREFTFDLLADPSMAESEIRNEAGYYWSQIATSFVEQFPDQKWRLFENVLLSATAKWQVLAELDSFEGRALTNILIENPTKAWEIIGRVFDDQTERRGFALQHWLEGGTRVIGDEVPGPIQYVPSNVLFEWVAADIGKRGSWLSRLLPKSLDHTESGRLTRNFIAKFGKEDRLLRGLHANFHSRGWYGNASDRYRQLRSEAREWLVDEKNTHVICWVEEYIESLDFDIKRAEIEEERRH